MEKEKCRRRNTSEDPSSLKKNEREMMEHRGNGNGMMTMGRNKRVGLINRFFLVPRRRANISCMLDHYNDASKEGLNDGLVETFQHGPDLVNLPHSLTYGQNIHTHTG